MGAAIAAVTSQIISAVILIVYFVRKGNMRLPRASMKLAKYICKSIFYLGISSGITQSAATVLQIVLNNALVIYGNKSSVGGYIALSAMGIVSKISMIILAICIGIGIDSQPILGFNKGAGNIVRMPKTYLSAIAAATICSFIGWTACQLFSGNRPAAEGICFINDASADSDDLNSV